MPKTRPSLLRFIAPRPQPPADVAEYAPKQAGIFRAAPELDAWTREVFMTEASPLYDEIHSDVLEARIGWLWTSEPRSRYGQTMLGETSLAAPPRGLSGWEASLYRHLADGLFMPLWGGEERPDFKIVIFAPWFAAASNLSALALIKHELCHCRHAVGANGPRFTVEGRPVWGIRGHDLEDFSPVVRWFGLGALGSAARTFVEAATLPPLAGEAVVDGICGTCARAT